MGMLTTILLDFQWGQLLNPEFYISNGGLWLFLFIVFAETGLFAGFFLPGDSLLFVAGIYSNELASYLFNTGYDFSNLMLIVVLTSIACILGNTVGYLFGRNVGPAMYHWPDNFLYKKKYLHQAHDFYEKHGGGAIIFARFLPIVRTFAPIVAGIVQMDRRKFGYFNLIGGIVWSVCMLFMGHYLYKICLRQFNFDLKSHLEAIVIGIILVTTAPVIFKIIFGKVKNRN
jgi:membrane-associated protein